MDITSPSVRSIRPNPSIEPTVQAVSLETAVMWNVPACSCWVRLGRGGMSALSPFYPQLRTLVAAAGTAVQYTTSRHSIPPSASASRRSSGSLQESTPPIWGLPPRHTDGGLAARTQLAVRHERDYGSPHWQDMHQVRRASDAELPSRAGAHLPVSGMCPERSSPHRGASQRDA